MSKRRLTLTIDADPFTCGDCTHQSLDSCDLFDTLVHPSAMSMLGQLVFARAPACLAAEDAARPWQASEDDDDPTPHHLQEKP